MRDGEVQPACVQSCPTGAFVFGDLMLRDSRVSQLFEHPRRYQVLEELNTKPAVVYLKRIKPQSAEIRSTKSEIRNKSRSPNPNDQNGEPPGAVSNLAFEFRMFRIAE